MSKNSYDKKLFFRIKKKDKNAFIEAYDLYSEDIYRFVFFKVGSAEDAKDLTSAAFLKVWNYVQSQGLDESKSLRAFIYKTARNLIVDHYRRLRENEGRLDDNAAGLREIISDEKQNLALQSEILSDMELVKEKMKELKDEYREMILMRFIDELSFAEIADVTGKTAGSVRIQTYRALQALKELLEEKKSAVIQ
ncbi:MAG TPA: RNA polymerase sigma factor [Candidatus Nanoarchaeia archaeon]|nr:RNA polymerase sigma factor [Candidatus Nanoarchaeia archaeon]